ncbi:hypothetical protein C3F00_036685, partial [Pseudomonas sp. MWU13-2860]
VTSYLMLFAPLAVLGAIAATVAKEGLSILATYGKFMAEFYLSIGILWGLLILAGGLFIGTRVLKLMGMMREPLLLSFTTASSLTMAARLASAARITSVITSACPSSSSLAQCRICCLPSLNIIQPTKAR